jgi:hypothetical protein
MANFTLNKFNAIIQNKETNFNLKMRLFYFGCITSRIFGPKREEVAGGWIMYASPNIIRLIISERMRWAGNVACMGEMRNAYSILVGKPEGKRPFGRPRRKWEDIRMDLREIGWKDVDWVHMAQDRDQWQDLVNTVINLRVPKKEGSCLSS